MTSLTIAIPTYHVDEEALVQYNVRVTRAGTDGQTWYTANKHPLPTRITRTAQEERGPGMSQRGHPMCVLRGGSLIGGRAGLRVPPYTLRAPR